MTVQRLTEVLTVNSTLIEVGGTFGASWQLGRSIALQALGSTGIGFGFANVSAASSIYKLLFGLSVQL